MANKKQEQSLMESMERERDKLTRQHQDIVAREAAATDPEEKKRLRTERLALEARQNTSREEMQKAYEKAVKDKPKPTPWLKNLIWAFCVGGIICVIGQALNIWFSNMGLDEKMAGAAVTSVLVVATGLLTGFGIFDEIGRRAGAGPIVPVTGFANSIVSASLEFKNEGFVYGVGYRLFTVAGPVIVYGTIVSAIIGVIFYYMG